MKNLETTTTSSQNVVVPTTAPEVTQTVPMITPVDAMNTPKKILFGLWSFLKLVLLGILIFFGIFYGV